MQRLINSAFSLTMSSYYCISSCYRGVKVIITSSMLFLFASGRLSLFAASNDLNSSNTNWRDLIWALVWVAVLTLVVAWIYVWFRRNKVNLLHLLRRDGSNRNRQRSQYRSTTPFSRLPTMTTDESEEGPPDQLVPSDREAYTLEAISLKELEQVLLLREEGHLREFYESIAMIIKQYVSEKYQIKIVDATTSQILESLPHDLTDSIADHVGEILRTCDMIHFSRHRPSRSELRGIYQTAKEFIESQIVVLPAETDSPEEEETDERNRRHEYYR